jgi:hypothetical protein
MTVNPVPRIVSVVGPDPAETEDGDSCVIVGAVGIVLWTTKVTAFDGPPPGLGLETTTAKLPTAPTSEALSEIVSWPLFTNVAAWDTPLKVTVDDAIKPLPLTVRIREALPAEAEDGDRLVIVGSGLLAACTVKPAATDVPPPGAGFETVTGKVPALARSFVGTAAVSSLRFTKVVARGVPLKFTVEEVINPLPLIVSVSGPLPVEAEAGDRLVTRAGDC